jgi:hypothetical protein
MATVRVQIDGQEHAVDGATAEVIVRLVRYAPQLAALEKVQVRFHIAGQRVKGPQVVLSLERDGVQ